MRIDFYGLCFDTPRATFYLWTPWRSAALEHKLFDVVAKLPNVQHEKSGDELCVHIEDPKTFKTAIQSISRVLKGWQEEAEMGGERRGWRWLLEGDANADGFDHNGDPVSLWGLLRVSLDRGGLGEPEKGEDVDMEGFGLRIWGAARE